MDDLKKELLYKLGIVHEEMGNAEESLECMKQIYQNRWPIFVYTHCIREVPCIFSWVADSDHTPGNLRCTGQYFCNISWGF